MEHETYFRYWPVSPRDQDWGIYVTTAGYVNVAPGAEYPPAGHPKGYAFNWQQGRKLHEFQIHYITRGGGIFESKTGGHKQIEPGSIFLLFPGEWHRYTANQKTGWHEYWIGFDGDYARRLFRKGFLTLRSPVLKQRGEHALLDLFTDVVGEMRAGRIGFSQVIGATTALILAIIHAASLAGRRIRSPAEAMIRRTKSLLHERLDQPVELQRLADELHVGSAWLRRNFRDQTGLTLNHYHLQLRINRAMHLLSGTSASVKEIAAQTGFEDPHYFSRVFKKKTASNPKTWRRLYQAKGKAGKVKRRKAG
ncbi:MAG: AraC family transcriptional regulator [Verrucomicrobiota bacterium]